MSMQPVVYWRERRVWPRWLGQRGHILHLTTIHVAATELSSETPYQLAVVDFHSHRQTFMVAAGQTLQPGDQVECVLRRMGTPDDTGVIPYGIKVVQSLHDSSSREETVLAAATPESRTTTAQTRPTASGSTTR